MLKLEATVSSTGVPQRELDRDLACLNGEWEEIVQNATEYEQEIEKGAMSTVIMALLVDLVWRIRVYRENWLDLLYRFMGNRGHIWCSYCRQVCKERGGMVYIEIKRPAGGQYGDRAPERELHLVCQTCRDWLSIAPKKDPHSNLFIRAFTARTVVETGVTTWFPSNGTDWHRVPSDTVWKFPPTEFADYAGKPYGLPPWASCELDPDTHFIERIRVSY